MAARHQTPCRAGERAKDERLFDDSLPEHSFAVKHRLERMFHHCADPWC
jgi:hypothetical protein